MYIVFLIIGVVLFLIACGKAYDAITGNKNV